MLGQTDATLKAWLAKAIGAGGPFDPVKCFVGVASSIANKGAATTMADVAEATGKMGTRVEVTAWSPTYKLNDGRWVADGPVCRFSPLDKTESQVVSSWFIADADVAGVLVAWGSLGGQIPVVDENHAISIVPRICFDPAGNFDASEVFEG